MIPSEIIDMKSKVLQAFMEQQKYTDEEAIAMENAVADMQNENFRKGMEQLGRPQEISKNLSVPTQLKEGELDQKTESHPHFKNYDHSLEKMRRSFKSEDIDGVERDISHLPEGTDYNLPEHQFGIDWGSLGDQLGT
jgi:hypothetical protein